MKSSYSYATRTNGLEGAIGLYLGLFICIFAAFAGGLYWLLQPTVRNNPGLRVYQPPPATVAGAMPGGRPSRIAVPVAREVAAPRPSPAEKADPAAEKARERPARAVASQERVKPAAHKAKKKKPRQTASRLQRNRVAQQRRRGRDPLQDYAGAGRSSNSRPSWQRSWTYRQAVDRGFIQPQ
jgi:hypothetical protein